MLHINGNAAYAIGDEEFRKFLGAVQFHFNRLSFDVAIITYYSSDSSLLLLMRLCSPCLAPSILTTCFVVFYSQFHRMREKVLRASLHRYVYTELILQMAGLPPLHRDEFEELLLQHPETTMLHGRKLLFGADDVERGRRKREER